MFVDFGGEIITVAYL